jgi:hypothetical protein
VVLSLSASFYIQRYPIKKHRESVPFHICLYACIVFRDDPWPVEADAVSHTRSRTGGGESDFVERNLSVTAFQSGKRLYDLFQVSVE